MKLKKQSNIPDAVSAKKRSATLLTSGKVKIHVGESIKQSLNYQSAEANYGIEIEVDNTDNAIELGFKRAEELIEERLTVKYREQRTLLEGLAANA